MPDADIDFLQDPDPGLVLLERIRGLLGGHDLHATPLADDELRPVAEVDFGQSRSFVLGQVDGHLRGHRVLVPQPILEHPLRDRTDDVRAGGVTGILRDLQLEQLPADCRMEDEAEVPTKGVVRGQLVLHVDQVIEREIATVRADGDRVQRTTDLGNTRGLVGPTRAAQAREVDLEGQGERDVPPHEGFGRRIREPEQRVGELHERADLLRGQTDLTEGQLAFRDGLVLTHPVGGGSSRLLRDVDRGALKVTEDRGARPDENRLSPEQFDQFRDVDGGNDVRARTGQRGHRLLARVVEHLLLESGIVPVAGLDGPNGLEEGERGLLVLETGKIHTPWTGDLLHLLQTGVERLVLRPQRDDVLVHLRQEQSLLLVEGPANFRQYLFHFHIDSSRVFLFNFSVVKCDLL